jgi:MFS family permease
LHISKNSKILPAFVGACFFLSGAAGLVYEVLWVRMIDKVIGSAPFAVATVLTVFMAGLALGSYLAGRIIDRFTSRSALLALYGKLEAGIGACALAQIGTCFYVQENNNNCNSLVGWPLPQHVRAGAGLLRRG